MRYRNTLDTLEADLQLIEEKYSVESQNENAFVLAADKARDAGKKEFEFPKGSGKMHPVTIKVDIEEEIEQNNENYQQSDLDEKKRRRKRKKRTKQKASDIPGYRRGRSKKQLKTLNKVTAKAAAGKFTSADYEREDKRRQRELPKGYKTPKNPFTGKIAVGEAVKREELRSLIESILKEELEEKRKRRKSKKRKTKKKKRATLSKKTMATLRKKAKSSGYTAGSLASEYRKGLGAYYTSGSRKGMGAHQWAMARVNSAIGKGNPSWANLKRSKAKKK